MSSRDFLERMRPSGTPGAATRSGVPADRVAERSAELEPVLARLADAQQEAERIRQEGRRAAQERTRTAAEQARAIVAEARHVAHGEREQAAAQARAEAAPQADAALAAAHRDAAAIAERAEQRTPELVERVVALARAELARVVQEP